jgi:threonine/homoserine/homoserine lactone efflux protein
VRAAGRVRAGAAFRYAGVVYLVWLGWTLWRATPDASPIERDGESRRQFFAGATLALGNPKTMLFHLAVLPAVVDLDVLSLREAVLLAVIVVTVVGGVLATYELLALRLRRRLHSPIALRRAHRVSAVLMVGAAGVVASR